MSNRSKCLSCYSTKIVDIIDLGKHPFADSFTKKKVSLKTYPLVVQLCKKCNFIQNKFITNDNSRYNEIDYSYLSSNSNAATNHWKKYISEIKKKGIIIKNNSVLEIGSNDGFFLSEINKESKFSLGIEASKYMYNLTKKNNLNVLLGILGKIPKKKLSKYFNKFDLIIANNVFNHSNDPSNFLKQVNNLLNKNGKFVFEQPYWLNTIKDLRFDLIYHEHVIHSSIKSLLNILKSRDLHFYDCELVNYHGVSIRVYCSNDKSIRVSKKMESLLNNENKYKLNYIKTYKSYLKKIEYRKVKFLNKLNNFIALGFTPICIGAAAKGNTFLNYYGLSDKIIKFVTDSSKDKINKFTPHSSIQILHDSELKKIKKPLCIILSWNISKILKPKLQKLNQSIVFLDT